MPQTAGVRRPAFVGLLRQPDFLKLWVGLTVSLFGMQVSGLALPLTAVLLLGASASEMGVLGAARWLPYLLVGLFAGVWLDRVRRRPVLIATHIGCAVLLASIPVAAVLGVLHIEQLYVVSFVPRRANDLFRRRIPVVAAIPRFSRGPRRRKQQTRI